MSGLNSIFNIATSGVLAQQTAIAATAENIANVTTPDFTRREVNFSADPVPGQFSGVTVDIARAATNEFLQNAASSGASDAASLSRIADSLSRVVDSLGQTGDNLSFANRVDEALASLVRLNASPSSSAAQAEAVANLDAAFAAFARTQNAIQGEIDQATTGLGFEVERANQILEEIFTLNTQIAASGDNPSGPQDALSARISELSGLLSIDVSRDDIGRATIATGEGRILANASGFAALRISGSTLGVTGISTNPGNEGLIANDIGGEISGGSLGGSLNLLSNDLPQLATLVSNAQTAFANALNAASASNTVFPAPTLLAGTQIVNDDAINLLSGRTTLARIDDQGILRGRIDIDFSNNTLSIDGAPAQGFTPTVTGFVDAINNSAGTNITAVITNGVLSLNTALPNGEGLALSGDSAGFGALFGFNPIAVGNSGGFQVSEDIRNNPANLASGRLDLTTAVTGDVVTGVNDGSGAAALFAAGRTQSETIANALGEIGARSVNATSRANVAEAFNEDIAARVTAEGGVNLEQELSNLILFQRSFNANARVIAAADELYQSILALI